MTDQPEPNNEPDDRSGPNNERGLSMLGGPGTVWPGGDGGEPGTVLVAARLDLAPVPASRPKVGRWSTYYPAAYADYMVQAAAALAAVSVAEPIGGPVVGRFGFQIPRPASHYRSGRFSHLLKDSAPSLPVNKRAGDGDNLEKALLDALVSAGILADDSLVVDWAGRKRYGGHPRTFLQIERATCEGDPFGCFF